MAFIKNKKRYPKTSIHSYVTSVDLTPKSKHSNGTYLTPKYEQKFQFNVASINLNSIEKQTTVNTVNYNTANNQIFDIKEKIEDKNIKQQNNNVIVNNANSVNGITNSPIPRSVSASIELNSSQNSTYAINQAEFGLREYIKYDRSKFIERLCKGPPESFRWIAWMIAADINSDRSEEFYINLLSQEINEKTDIQIKKDLNRTSTDEKLFSVDTTKSTLYNVLRAYANCDKDVSYCQGMNFIAAFLLIVSDFNEIDTHYMMMYLFMFDKSNNLGIRGFFMDDFPLLYLYNYQFNFLFAKHLPNLKNHFDVLEIPAELWISKWFQTLFTICLPIDMLLRLWDCVFAKGLDFLFNFAIVLIKLFEDELLKFEDISDISEFFKNINSYSNTGSNYKFDVEGLISDALKFKISKNLLNNLKIEYEEKFKIDLSFLKVNYDLKSYYNSVNSNKDSIEIFENRDFPNKNANILISQVKIDLKSKFIKFDNDTILEEEANKTFIDMNNYKTSTNLNIYADSNGDLSNDDNCSEFEVFDTNLINNVTTHTLSTKCFEEESKKGGLKKN